MNGAPGPASAPTSDAIPALAEVCRELRRKVTAFLEEQTDNEVLQGVQNQVRVSLGVIEEAMRRYG